MRCSTDNNEGVIEDVTTNMRRLVRLIEEAHLQATSELVLQDGLEHLFSTHGIKHVREHSLSRQDRVDFMIGNIACEVKIGGGVNPLQRQLGRYAEHEEVEAILLVTTLPRLAKVPCELDGKRVGVALVLGGI